MKPKIVIDNTIEMTEKQFSDVFLVTKEFNTTTEFSQYIEKISNESGEVTAATIREENKEKQKTFDSDLGEAGEVLEKTPEEDIEAIENESEVIKFSTAVVADAIKSGFSDIHIEP